MSNYEPTEGAVDAEVDVQLNDSETDDRLVHTHTLTQRLILYIFYCYSNIMQDVAGHDLPASPATTSSRAAFPATFEPPLKQKRKANGSDIDDALIMLSRTALERRLLKDKREAEK